MKFIKRPFGKFDKFDLNVISCSRCNCYVTVAINDIVLTIE